MKRYRRKPEIVEAQQWHEGDKALTGMRLRELSNPGVFYARRHSGETCRVRSGDWIIKYADGRSYVVQPEVFMRQYEPAEEP